MAYRVKGLYTLKQRQILIRFIHLYHDLINSSDASVATKHLAQTIFYPFTLMAQVCLAHDDQLILQKIMAPALQNTKEDIQ